MGAGAVGSFYGAMLARAGHEVTLIGRPAHVQAIEADGLMLEMAGSVQAVRLHASSDVGGAARCGPGAVLRQVHRHRGRGAPDGAVPGRSAAC